MNKTLLALMTVLLMPAAFAKAPLSDEQQHRLVELNRLEDMAHVKLQQAEQAALMGEVSSNQLGAMRMQYEVAKSLLQRELSKLPNRSEIEQWLIDNHVGVEE